MDEIVIFPVPDKDFRDTAEFMDYLRANHDFGEVKQPLTVVVGVTERSRKDLESQLIAQGFTLMRRLGTVLHLHAPVEGESALECYLGHDEDTGVLRFVTNFRKTEEIPRINELLKSDLHSYYLFIPPLLLRETLYSLEREYDDMEISDFTARRSSGSVIPAKMRPKSRRTFSYWGDDGRDTLAELEELYGILAQRAIVTIPGVCKFGIDCRGFMTFHSGDLDCPLRVLDSIVEKARNARGAYDLSSYDSVLIGTSENRLELGVSSPVTIALKAPLEAGDVSEFHAKLEDGGFSVIDSFVKEGSLLLSSDIISKTGQHYRIKSNGPTIKMYPDDARNLHGFMQFYEFVVDEVDPDARLVL